MSWALSCLRIKEYYDEIELVTDEAGKVLLIDKLQLPYTNVIVELNTLDKYNSDLWTLSKVYAYSIQKKPFIHIDSDVYVWKKFNKIIELAPLVAQNIEFNHTFYHTLLNQTENTLTMPDVIIEERKRTLDIFTANTGIVGGNRLDFFRMYSDIIFSFIDDNLDKLDSINKSILGVTIEQYLYYVLANHLKIPITCYFNDINEGNYSNLLNFYGIPHKTSFIHVIGSSNKKSNAITEQVEVRLRIEYPSYYYKINSLLHNLEV